MILNLSDKVLNWYRNNRLYMQYYPFLNICPINGNVDECRDCPLLNLNTSECLFVMADMILPIEYLDIPLSKFKWLRIYVSVDENKKVYFHFSPITRYISEQYTNLLQFNVNEKIYIQNIDDAKKIFSIIKQKQDEIINIYNKMNICDICGQSKHGEIEYFSVGKICNKCINDMLTKYLIENKGGYK